MYRNPYTIHHIKNGYIKKHAIPLLHKYILSAGNLTFWSFVKVHTSQGNMPILTALLLSFEICVSRVSLTKPTIPKKSQHAALMHVVSSCHSMYMREIVYFKEWCIKNLSLLRLLNTIQINVNLNKNTIMIIITSFRKYGNAIISK